MQQPEWSLTSRKKLKAVNTLSEPLVNYAILFSLKKKNIQNWAPIKINKYSDSHFIQNREALVYMLFITAYNSLK